MKKYPIMQKSYPLLVLAFAGAIFVSTTSRAAEGWSPREFYDNPASFLSGFAGGIAVHELGHAIVAKSKGYAIGHAGLSITYGSQSIPPRDQRRIASAGFAAQWIGSEVAFAEREKNGGNFTAGFICAHLAISAAYLTVLKNQRLGDSVGYSNASSLSSNQVVLRAAIPALMDGWRLFGDNVPGWVPSLSMATKGVGITAIWAH